MIPGHLRGLVCHIKKSMLYAREKCLYLVISLSMVIMPYLLMIICDYRVDDFFGEYFSDYVQESDFLNLSASDQCLL